MQKGWSRKTLDGKQGDEKALPMIVRADGTNNGAWFKYGHMWVQNEDTVVGRDKQVESRSFSADLVANQSASHDSGSGTRQEINSARMSP